MLLAQEYLVDQLGMIKEILENIKIIAFTNLTPLFVLKYININFYKKVLTHKKNNGILY